MKKTNGMIRVFLGLSIMFLVSGFYHFYIDGLEVKVGLRIAVGIFILTVLYIKEFKNNNIFLRSLKDSLPYFTVLFLIGDLAQIKWFALILASIIFIADFSGDG